MCLWIDCFIFLLYQILSIGLATAQKRTENVITFKGCEPIIGASVFVKDTAKGAVLGSDGAFDLDVLSSAKTMVYLYVKYR